VIGVYVVACEGHGRANLQVVTSTSIAIINRFNRWLQRPELPDWVDDEVVRVVGMVHELGSCCLSAPELLTLAAWRHDPLQDHS
jgi:hypothetical protein